MLPSSCHARVAEGKTACGGREYGNLGCPSTDTVRRFPPYILCTVSANAKISYLLFDTVELWPRARNSSTCYFLAIFVESNMNANCA
jgi:hypothetical protein